MLLIVGGEHDAEALAAASVMGARLVSASDLSRPGWSLRTDEPGLGRFVAAGEVMDAADITGVLVRRMAVYPQELAHVCEADREYVASEMTALLMWWLHALPVKVLNRPAGGVLCGPGWRPEKWRAVAAALGYPVESSVCSSREPARAASVTTEVVVVGETVVGNPPAELRERALGLARAGGASLLCASFTSGGALVSAHPMPGLSGGVLAAIVDCLRVGS